MTYDVVCGLFCALQICIVTDQIKLDSALLSLDTFKYKATECSEHPTRSAEAEYVHFIYII